MPVIVPIVLAAAATSLGAASIVAAGVGDIIGAGLVADVIGGAVVGSAVGAVGAAVQGGDVGQGALWSAVSGGITGGLGYQTQDALDAAANAGLPSSAANTVMQDLTGITDKLGAAALTQGLVTSGVSLARGAPIEKALEIGAASGALSYAGNEALANLKFGSTDAGSTAPGTAASTATTSAQPANVTDAGVEQVVQTATKDIGPIPIGVVADSTQTPSQDKKGGVEQVVDTATRTPSIFDGFSSAFNDVLSAVQDQPQPVKSAEKALLSQQIMGLIFPSSAGGGTGTGTSTSAGAGSTGPSVAAQAAQAAQVGQTGGTSIYGPGGPIFGEPAGATKYSPWNVASLRTDQGNA